MSMCRARAAWRTHASAWNGCCSSFSGALAAVERLAPHAIPAGPGTDGAACFAGLRRRLAPQPALPRLSVRRRRGMHSYYGITLCRANP